MPKRLEMPPQCARCDRYSPRYGEYCARCVGHAAWRTAIAKAWDLDQVRVDGLLWEIRPEPRKPRRGRLRPTGGYGMGRQTFRIHFNDGRRVTTRNLWSVGDIPAEYRESLPDNARFIHERRASHDV